MTVGKVCAGMAICSGLAFGQQPAPMAMPLKADLIKTGLYVIAGPGGNTVVRLGGEGTVLVDAQPEGSAKGMMAKVRRISESPVRALLFTHGGEKAVSAVTGAQVVVQTKLAQQVGGGENAVMFEHEYTIHGGGVQVKLLHFGAGHADGDTVVYFADKRVVAVGDLYTAGAPEIDGKNGGSWEGWSAALAEVLRLDFDGVVPAHGPVATRADLEKFKLAIDGQARLTSAGLGGSYRSN